MDRLPCCMLVDVLSFTDPAAVTQIGGSCRLLWSRCSGDTTCSSPGHRGFHASIESLWKPLPQPPVHYIDSQPDITRQIRCECVEWIGSILRNFDAPGSVFERAVDMLDAHLSQNHVRNEELTNVCCAVMGAALGQWGESSARAAGTRPAIRLDDLARAILVLKTQSPCMDALELLHLPGPYDCWTRLAVLISDYSYSLEQVRQMQVLVAASGWHWLSRSTTSCHARRFAHSAHLPRKTWKLALSFSSFMLFDLVFRRWSPEVRGAACAMLAVVCSEQHQRQAVSKSQRTFKPFGMIRKWWQGAPYALPSHWPECSCNLQALVARSEHLDGLPCCITTLVRFLEKSTKNGLLRRTTGPKDPAEAEFLCQVSWEDVMAHVVEIFQGVI